MALTAAGREGADGQLARSWQRAPACCAAFSMRISPVSKLNIPALMYLTTSSEVRVAAPQQVRSGRTGIWEGLSCCGVWHVDEVNLEVQSPVGEVAGPDGERGADEEQRAPLQPPGLAGEVVDDGARPEQVDDHDGLED